MPYLVARGCVPRIPFCRRNFDFCRIKQPSGKITAQRVAADRSLSRSGIRDDIEISASDFSPGGSTYTRKNSVPRGLCSSSRTRRAAVLMLSNSPSSSHCRILLSRPLSFHIVTSSATGAQRCQKRRITGFSGKSLLPHHRVRCRGGGTKAKWGCANIIERPRKTRSLLICWVAPRRITIKVLSSGIEKL